MIDVIDISILIPSIRFNLLEGVYDSIAKSFSGSWELVLISPYPLPAALQDKKNITYIKDAGSPIRARQRGLLAATGKYLCYAADDVLFYPNALNIAYEKIKDQDYRTLILGKYVEGDEINKFMRSDEYYYLSTHDLLKKITQRLPSGNSYLLLNTGLIAAKLLKEVGGFDCAFEACAISCVDLSIRLQNYGCKIIIQQEPFFKSTHLPGAQGDHGPIHEAQVGHDQPLLFLMYMNEDATMRKIIPIDNWENTPSWWTRRFGPQA